MTVEALLYYSSHLQNGLRFLDGGHARRQQRLIEAIGKKPRNVARPSKLVHLPTDFNAGLTSLQEVERVANDGYDSRFRFASLLIFLNNCLKMKIEEIKVYFTTEFPETKKDVEAMCKTLIDYTTLTGGDPHLFMTAFSKDKRDCPKQDVVLKQTAKDTSRSSNENKGSAMTYDDFNILSLIGKGSFSKVVQAEHKETKKLYAIKIIKKEMFIKEGDPAWIQTEKNIFAICKNHPFLVGLHYSFQSEARLFFVIDYVPGGDLQYLLRRVQKIPGSLASFYVAEVSVALYFLHSQHIIHRDLKLRNVFLDADGHIKVSDYGLSKEMVSAGELSETLCGTASYIAPEMLDGNYDYSVDWWALGVMLYEMLTGELIGNYINEDFEELEDEVLYCQHIIQAKLQKKIDLPGDAVSAIHQFLNSNPKERLGCGKDIHEGYLRLQNHSFFEKIDWKLLEKRQVLPPFKPNIKDARDIRYFNPKYTKQDARLTIVNPATIAKIDQSEFLGFEHTELELMEA